MMMKECHWVELANIAMFLSINIKLTSEKNCFKNWTVFPIGWSWKFEQNCIWMKIWWDVTGILCQIVFGALFKDLFSNGISASFLSSEYCFFDSFAYIWLCFESLQKWTKIVFCTLTISAKLDWLTWFLNCNCAIIQKILNCVLPAFISPHSPTRLHHCHVKAVIELSEFHLCLHNRSTSLLASIHLSPHFLLSPLASCCFFPFLLHTLPKTYKTKS